MDRKEAIQYIKDRCIGTTDPFDGTKWSDAMWTAIEALQKYDDCVEALKEMLELKAEPKCKQCLYNPEHPFTVNCSEIPTGSLISRQDAIEAVADGLKGVFVEYRDVAEKLIGKLPSAESKTGECKDCTHWDKLDYGAPRQGWCDQFEDWTDADEYCSRYAKMRGEL